MTLSSLPFASIFYLSSGAVIGTLSRFYIYELAKSYYGHTFWATLSVNLLGSFFIGCLWVIFNYYNAPRLALFFIPGLLGAFTTFSTFSLDAFKLINNGQLLLCFANISSQVILGISFCYLGVKIVSKILPVSL